MLARKFCGFIFTFYALGIIYRPPGAEANGKQNHAGMLYMNYTVDEVYDY